MGSVVLVADETVAARRDVVYGLFGARMDVTWRFGDDAAALIPETAVTDDHRRTADDRCASGLRRGPDQASHGRERNRVRLAAGRRVVTFDNRGVGGTTGLTPNTIEAMAHDAIAFVAALGLNKLLQRVSAIDLPAFVANGDSDPMILPRYSYLLTGLLPDARLTSTEDSAHGFLFQHHSRFAADVDDFLAAAG